LLQRSQTVDPYSQLATVYDHLMRHVNYRQWAIHLRRLFRRADFQVREVLDISCGTGSLALELSHLGFGVFGFDMSHTMIEVARRKLVASTYDVPVWVASMADFGVRHAFHAIVCTYDSLNYCSSLAVCSAVLENVARALKPGGVFVFDVSTRHNSKTNFQNYYDKERTDHFKYIRQSYFLPKENKQVNEFFVTYFDGSHKTFHEHHEQKIYPIAALRNIIQPTVFELIGIFDGFSTMPGSETSDRVHFLIKKKQSI